MIESGFFHSALRVLTQEERALINKAYIQAKKKGRGEILPAGHKKLGSIVSREDCDAVVAYLKNEKGFMSQVPMQSDGTLYSYTDAERLGLSHSRYFSFPPSTSLRNPVISKNWWKMSR